MTAKSAAPATEVEAFLAAHPDVTGIELLLPDGSGVIRGKRLAREGLLKFYREGVALPSTIFALDITGADIPEAGLQWDEGDADRVCWPVPGTLKPVLAPAAARPGADDARVTARRIRRPAPGAAACSAAMPATASCRWSRSSSNST
jgi:glutamine synthetase